MFRQIHFHSLPPAPFRGRSITAPLTATIMALAYASGASGQTIFSQDFEGLTLGPPIDETSVPGAAVWTKSPPAGWTIDDTGVAGIGQAGVGVTEWKGWSFAKKDWWAQVAEDQRRSEFARGTGTVAIADPDEWDDTASSPAALGTFNSFLKTPPIDITGIRANSLVLKFDSSFRPEGNQKAAVSVSYDGGAANQIIEWIATADTKTNEPVAVDLGNPATATSMVITFGMTNAVNNWFWAIDNIKVERVGPLFEENFNSLPLMDSIEEPNAGTNVWTNIPPLGWNIDNSLLFKGFFDPDPPPDDFLQWVGRSEWKGWAFATIAWWPTVDNQRRSEFTKATGTVAIADPDEWDDSGSPSSSGRFNSFLNTPKISLSGIPANTVLLKFDSSWRPECCDEGDQTNNQTGTVEVSFDGGPKIKVVDWSSNPADPTYKNDNSTNDTILVPVPNPAGAKTMEMSFGLTNATNDWFWAVDNISLTAGAASLASITPSPKQVVFEIADTGANKITVASIQLKIDGVTVPVTATPQGTILRVTHTPAANFPPATQYAYLLTALDTGGNQINFSGNFTTPTPALPLTPLAGPTGTAGNFGVRYLWGTTDQISGVARSVAVIQSADSPTFDGLFFDTAHPIINHGDGAGFIPNDLPYPDEVITAERWDDEDFIQLAKGRIRIAEAGVYTFGIHSDDGFAFRIFGAEFTKTSGAGVIDAAAPNTVIHPADTGDSNTRAVVTLAAGDYDLEFFWWERGGGDYGELYAAKGDFANDADTDTWKSIGEEGGLALVGPAGSTIRITNVAKTTNAVNLTFSVEAGKSYIAQYSLDLVTWTNIGPVIQPAAGATSANTSVSLAAPPLQSAASAFVRIKEN
jgi:hypothetical protein